MNFQSKRFKNGYSFCYSHLFSRFDVTGYVTGFGHPDWVGTHEPASSTSPVVSTLVEGGATCVGKTVVDELAFRFLSLLCEFVPISEFQIKIIILSVSIRVVVQVIPFCYFGFCFLQYQWRNQALRVSHKSCCS